MPWFLGCPKDRFRLEDKTAAKPVCPTCGGPLHIITYPMGFLGPREEDWIPSYMVQDRAPE